MSRNIDTPEGEVGKEQKDRTERAKAAIRAGKFQITRVGPQQWSVQNGEKLPYSVSLEGDTWVCTCMDYQQRGPAILCKHIEGVRLSETAQSSIETLKESPMEHTQTHSEETMKERFDRILWELRQPLDMSRVKRRQAPGLGSVPYLEGFDVINRANEIFGYAWSFDLISEPLIARWHKKILVWNQQERRKVPVTDANGNFQTEEVGLVYITGKVTVELNGKFYTHSDLGRCIFTGDTPEALDMALAGSATDCLKRCFRQLGEQFGNSLYDKEIAQSAGLDLGHENGSGNSGSASSSGSSKAPAPAASAARKYGDGTTVNGNASEQEAFDNYKKATGAAPASKEALRTWLSSRQRTASPSVAA
jgi:hypothetical protein